MTGEQIRSLRKRMGLNQTEFGSRLGTIQVTVSRWEREEQSPSPIYRTALANLARIAALDAPLSQERRR